MARVVDLGTVIDVLRGKLEFESGEEGREQAVLEHLLRRATADTAQRLLGRHRRRPAGGRGRGRFPGDHRRAGVGQGRAGRAARAAGGRRDRSAGSVPQTDGQRAAALELALEALYLAKRIDKVSGEGETVYG